MPPQDTPSGRSQLRWRVEFYRDRRGRVPVEDFLDLLPERERSESLRVIDLLEVYGLALGMPHARPIAGMWELRAGPGRIFYVAAVGRRFILLHGYRKKSQSAPQREIEIAQRRWAELLEREKGDRKP
jgi:phage-related protein